MAATAPIATRGNQWLPLPSSWHSRPQMLRSWPCGAGEGHPIRQPRGSVSLHADGRSKSESAYGSSTSAGALGSVAASGVAGGASMFRGRRVPTTRRRKVANSKGADMPDADFGRSASAGSGDTASPELSPAAPASSERGAVSESFFAACSTAAKWEDAIAEVKATAGQGFEAGIVFVDATHAGLAGGIRHIVEDFQKELDVGVLIACTCHGGIGNAVDGEMVSAPVEVERGSFLSATLLRKAGAVPFFLGRDGQGDRDLLKRKAKEGSVKGMVVIADPFAPQEELLGELDELFPSVPKVGGICTVLPLASQPNTFTASMGIAAEGRQTRALNQGIMGLMLENMEVHSVVCQGCLGLGPVMEITEAAKNVCTGLDGATSQDAARTVFRQLRDAGLEEKFKKGLVAGLASSDGTSDGDWLIRGIAGIDKETGGLVIGSPIEKGQLFRFHVRDQETAEDDLKMMLQRYRLERSLMMKTTRPIGCMVFTCNGRGESLYGRSGVDSQAAEEVLTKSAVSGFFCLGEIGSPGLSVPNGEPLKPTALHGFTAVIAVFQPV